MTNAAATTHRQERAALPSITDQLDGRYVAPRRFDAYEVPGFLERIRAESGHLVVDCSRVEFLDLSAHRALFDAAGRGSLTVIDPSDAVVFTCDLVAAVGPKPFGAAA